MLYNRYIFDKLATPEEAETGNAGEQPVRNNPANVNSWRFAPAYLHFSTIHITMPDKTHK